MPKALDELSESEGEDWDKVGSPQYQRMIKSLGKYIAATEYDGDPNPIRFAA